MFASSVRVLSFCLAPFRRITLARPELSHCLQFDKHCPLAGFAWDGEVGGRSVKTPIIPIPNKFLIVFFLILRVSETQKRVVSLLAAVVVFVIILFVLFFVRLKAVSLFSSFCCCCCFCFERNVK